MSIHHYQKYKNVFIYQPSLYAHAHALFLFFPPYSTVYNLTKNTILLHNAKTLDENNTGRILYLYRLYVPSNTYTTHIKTVCFFGRKIPI